MTSPTCEDFLFVSAFQKQTHRVLHVLCPSDLMQNGPVKWPDDNRAVWCGPYGPHVSLHFINRMSYHCLVNCFVNKALAGKEKRGSALKMRTVGAM